MATFYTNSSSDSRVIRKSNVQNVFKWERRNARIEYFNSDWCDVLLPDRRRISTGSHAANGNRHENIDFSIKLDIVTFLGVARFRDAFAGLQVDTGFLKQIDVVMQIFWL